MLATRFIIALCPATPIYLVKFDVPAKRIFSRHAATISTETTRVKTDALVFDTFEAAMEVAQDITGWGGAQRVEQVAVEVEDTRSTLDTPEARIEVRDAATAAWVEADGVSLYSRAAAVESAMSALGFKVGRIVRLGASCAVTVNLADHLGNTLSLDWDPMQDGFSYETDGDDACDIGETEAQHEAEPDHGCAGNCKPLSRKAARALRKWGNEKCQRAWHLNRLRGEGLTVCSAETGIPVRSVNSAINAWQEVYAQLSDCERGAPTCDGCGATDAEPCGDSDGHAFCAACRAKSQAEPKAADPITFDPAFIDAVLGRDDLTMDQTPLTPEQAKHARAALTAALRSLVLANLPRLASSALVEAREIETADEPADDGDDDRYYSGTGESMDDDSYTDSLNGPGMGWCG